MMPGSDQLEPNDAILLRYLLGSLPVDEAEPIEEASVIDDDLSARVDAIERDLVDSYVRGELGGSNFARFQSWYLSSPLRIQKVAAAREILRIADAVARDVSTPAAPKEVAARETLVAESSAAPVAKAVPAIAPNFPYAGVSGVSRWANWRFGKLSAWPTLGFAAALLILVVALGFLTNKNEQLRKEVAETKKQAELGDQTTAITGKNAAAGGLAHAVENVATVTMFLPAPTRGASTIPAVSVPAGTGLVVLSLGLGSGDENSYRAGLMDPATQKILWRSGILRPGSDGTYVSVTVPANLLRSKTYLVQLTHDAANGSSELLGSYPFRAEVK